MKGVRPMMREAACRGFALLLLWAGVPAAQSDLVTLMGHLELHGYQSDIWGYSHPDGTELAIVGGYEGTSFIDVTDPSGPVEVAYIPGPSSGWRDIKTYGGHAYVVNEAEGGLQIIDLADPGKPTLVRSYDAGFQTAHNLFIDTDTGVLYAVGTNNGMVVVDLASPTAPSILSIFDQYYIHDIFVRNGVGYAAAIYLGFLTTLDVTNPALVYELDRMATPGSFTHNTWLSEDGRTCFTTDETSGGHVGVYDVSNPAQILRIGEWRNPDEPSSSVHNVTVREDFLYASWYTAGLQVLDVRLPGTPQRVGSYDTNGGSQGFRGAWGVYPFGPRGLVYLSDIEGGLYVFRFLPRFARVRGTVTDGSSALPLPGVRIRVAGVSLERETDSEGRYEILLDSGQQEIAFEIFGYDTARKAFHANEADDITLDVALDPTPKGSVAGAVLDRATGEPVTSAMLLIRDTPLSTLSGLDGGYAFPEVPKGEYTMRVDRFGFESLEVPLSVAGGDDQIAGVDLVGACFADDMEDDLGWTAGAPDDDATGGLWTRVEPVEVYRSAELSQPGEDASVSGSHAWITGQADPGGTTGDSDVDGGKTTLESPPFDLSGAREATLTYRRWYRNDIGANPRTDIFLVEASGDDGATWVALETLTEPRNFWERMEFELSNYVPLSGGVRVRFIASDLGGPSIVEAGVDDVEIYCDRVRAAAEDTVGAVLFPVRPNPANLSQGPLLLRFHLPERQQVTLDVVDLLGRRIRRLVEATLDPGSHESQWDGRNGSGRLTASGVYLQRLETSQGIRTRKMVLTR